MIVCVPEQSSTATNAFLVRSSCCLALLELLEVERAGVDVVVGSLEAAEEVCHRGQSEQRRRNWSATTQHKKISCATTTSSYSPLD